MHGKWLALENNLLRLLVLTIPQIFTDIHPADNAIGTAVDKIYLARLILPILDMPLTLYREYFLFISLPFVEI